MAIIKNLPPLDRPREKALRYGISSLSDAELLAVLLVNGYKEKSVTELSTYLLNKYGGLKGLSGVSIGELKKNKGIKNAKAINLSAIFEFQRRLNRKESEENEKEIGAEYLYNKYRNQIVDSNQECVFLVILNCKKRIIYETNLSRGSENGVLFSFKEIYREVLGHNGKYYYLIHSHTSSDYSPSERDKVITNFLIQESKRNKIYLLDHIVISKDGYYSFLENEKN